MCLMLQALIRLFLPDVPASATVAGATWETLEIFAGVLSPA